MKILYIIPGDLWAGAEAQVFYTLKEIRRISGNEIQVLLFNRRELYHRLCDEGMAVAVVEEDAHNSLFICRFIKEMLSEKKPDILHVHEYKSHILGALAKSLSGCDCKMIRTVHGRTYVPFSLKYGRSYMVLRAEDILLRFFTPHIIAVSRDLEVLLRQKFRGTTIHQVNNGISADVAIRKTPGETRRQFGLGDDIFWIGTAVRLVSVKNVEMLLEAARILKDGQKGINFYVSVFGDGDLREELERKAITDGLAETVFFHGHQEDILSILNALDVFVLTSRNEGLPMSLLEAMAVGTVPVCTRVGGMKEVIEHGKNGFLVESDNPGELASMLSYLYREKDNLGDIVRKAAEKVGQNYSVEKCVRKLLEIYASL